MLIAIDVDSILFPLIKAAIQVGKDLNIDYPKNQDRWLPIHEIKTFDGRSITLEELTNLYRKTHSRDIMKNYDAFPGASAVIENLNQYNIDIKFLSDNHKQSYPTILEWLINNKLITQSNSDNFILTQDKRHWLRQYRPEIVIDDRVRTILMAKYELNAKVIALKQSWNVNLTDEVEGVYICKNWIEIGENLDTLIKSYMKGNSK